MNQSSFLNLIRRPLRSPVRVILLFAAYLLDGLFKVPEILTVYQSGTDEALGVSDWVFGRKRLGQFLGSEMSALHRKA